MSGKRAATFGAAFGGACGGVLAAGIAQYLSGDSHYLPLVIGTFSGAAIAGLTTAVVTGNNIGESAPNESSPDRDST